MRILLAEDDRALGLFLSRGLEADGHRIRISADGGAALEAFRQELPDLTILDLNLPVKDGERVLEEIRTLPANFNSMLNPTWIHAGAQHAEAGFEDPALGWISVRAGVDNGSVHASLIPSSDVASTALSGHLAGLNAFLSQQHNGVLGVTIAAPENNAGSASGMGSNAGQNSNQTLGQNSNHSSSGQGSEGPTQSGTEAVSSMLSRSASMTGADLQRPIAQTEFTPALRPGARISLMA